MKQTLYLAPALNCREIKAVYEWKDLSGTVVGKTTNEPSKVILGEPSDNLLALPSGYKESKPSELRNEYLAMRNVASAPDCVKDGNAKADERYIRLQLK